MHLPSTIDRELEDYGRLAYYDRLYPPLRVEKRLISGHTVPGSSSSQQKYTMTLVNLLEFTGTSFVSTTPIEWIVRKPTDEQLWLSLIGIFESGDPHFAEHHDQIYGKQA